MFLRMVRNLFIVLFMLIPFPVNAQAPVIFSRVVVNIWPEYDRPGVLVFYQITLSPETNLPASVSLRIPRSADKDVKVVMKDIDGRLDNLQTSSSYEGDWIKVVFTTPVPEIEFEYYDPSIILLDDIHEFVYEWPGDLDIESMVLIVQQPDSVQDFKIEPSMGSGRVDDDGFTYFESIIGKIKSGTPFLLKLSYFKSTSTLSAPAQSVFPVEPITTKSLGWQTLNEVLPYVLGGLGIILILASGYWYWRSGKKLTLAFRRRYFFPHAKEGEPEALENFCPQCGRKIDTGDLFCRTCGVRIKPE